MKEDTRQIIMDTAVKLFANKGFKETSMSKIAKEAEVGKGTIYWHFESKEDLFFSIIKEKARSYFKRALKLDDENMNAKEIIYQYIKDRIEFVENNYEVAQMLINNSNAINNEFKKLMEKRHKQMIAVLAKAITRGTSNGDFKKSDNKEVALMIVNTANSAHHNFGCSISGSIEEKANKIYKFIMYGLGGGEADDEEK